MADSGKFITITIKSFTDLGASHILRLGEDDELVLPKGYKLTEVPAIDREGNVIETGRYVLKNNGK